ncbi:aldo/keto reductase [Salinisphaera hydrothermalis]|uniref:Aldo/keto reductase n=1 Tax=Salinisphaera hydrothermalis (strain C41B8) TaxID=1304275 RepID=A0A084INH6_SALHC|nr:aldo/keto reductase [Salinisphaera hydrothermalis]KEZ78260.1 aldo/keto reductase [Salinisphaera hydrothermalis C41B8]
MEYRTLGLTELKTAPLIFGGNVFGWTLNEKDSFDMIDAWLDAGFNMIDTADVYSKWAEGHSGGESEALLGRYLAERGNRDRIVLASKVGMEMPDQGEGLSREWITTEIENSLRRLNTDYLDLYFAHTDDDTTPLDETMEAFDRLISDGKVRNIGASNYDGARLVSALGAARDLEVPRYEVLQPFYNLYDRFDFENDLAEICIEHDLGVTPYFSLASGFLTGKYRSRADAEGRARAPFVDKYFDDRGMRILAALDDVAARYDTTPAAIALAWLIQRRSVTAPIVSATSKSQFDQLVTATSITLDEAAVTTLDEASATPPEERE